MLEWGAGRRFVNFPGFLRQPCHVFALFYFLLQVGDMLSMGIGQICKLNIDRFQSCMLLQDVVILLVEFFKLPFFQFRSILKPIELLILQKIQSYNFGVHRIRLHGRTHS